MHDVLGEMQIKTTMTYDCTHFRMGRKKNKQPELKFEGRVDCKGVAQRDRRLMELCWILTVGLVMWLCTCQNSTDNKKSEFYVNLKFLKKHKGRDGLFLLSNMLDVTSGRRQLRCHHGWAIVKTDMCREQKRKVKALMQTWNPFIFELYYIN